MLVLLEFVLGIFPFSFVFFFSFFFFTANAKDLERRASVNLFLGGCRLCFVFEEGFESDAVRDTAGRSPSAALPSSSFVFLLVCIEGVMLQSENNGVLGF